MIQARTFGALLALGALTALPGCSYFGGGGGRTSEAAPTTQYTAPATHETAQSDHAMGGVSNVQQPITTALIRQVQGQLKHDRLYHGHIDGLWGPGSQHAAVLFQRRHHMNPTGKIDLPMLQAMNLAEGSSQYGEANQGPDNGMGANGQMGGQQYNQANIGQNGAPNGNAGERGNMGANGGMNGTPGANQNYSTGNQNPSGGANASNMPDQNNNTGAPNGGMNNGTTNQEPAGSGAPQR